LSNTVVSFNLPLSKVSVVVISSKNLRKATLPAFLNSFSCSAGLRKVFCKLLCASNPMIEAPFTLRPLSALCPVGSIFSATYLPSLRVFVLKTQSSAAPIISSGAILAV